jgi:hypothetical protein
MNIQMMDEETRKILDILSENDFSLAENIAIVVKVLAILLAIEERKITSEEDRQILQKVREKIAFFIISGEWRD